MEINEDENFARATFIDLIKYKVKWFLKYYLQALL